MEKKNYTNGSLKRLFKEKVILTLFLILAFNITIEAQPSQYLVVSGYDCGNSALRLDFPSVVDNDQDDSWDDENNPVTIKVNGATVFEGYYHEISGSNGRLNYATTAEGVTYSDEGITVLVYIPPKYLSNGSNSITISGTWEERVSGGSNDYTTVNETESFSFTKPDPPSGANASINEQGDVSLTWSNPTGSLLAIDIYRNGSQVAGLDASATSWTDPTPNLSSESYEIIAIGDQDGCPIPGSPATVSAPAPPKVSKPAGLTASTDRCDAKILVTWDYTGDVEPTGFELRTGSSGNININSGDIREYLHDVGNHTFETYKIVAIGPINTSGETSQATGSTSGDPEQPSWFSASRNGNYVHLSWDPTDYENKYVIVRNSASGTAEFEITKDQEYYDDKSVVGCETYTYELYAANECTEESGVRGIKASGTPPSIRIDPTTTLGSYLNTLNASKAYYPDKVVLEWTVKDGNLGFVDEFEILRRKAGESAYSTIGTVSGQSSYDDKTALGGVLYEYKLVARVQCEDDRLASNELYTVGFRIPYGIINGNISYENGVNVKGVDVMASKEGSAIGTSLYFDGGDVVIVSNETKLNPSEFIGVEAWVRPASVSGTSSIVNKLSGSTGYQLYLENADAVFQANINGSLESVRVQNVLNLNEYVHLAGVYDSTGLKIFVNGVVPTNTSYEIEQEDTSYLALAGIDQEVIDLMSGMVEVNYPMFDDFKSDLIQVLDTALAESILPLLLPVTKLVEYQPGTFDTTLSGGLSHTSSALTIGSGFNGNIDEIRIWNQARDEEKVFYDYKRIVGNDAKGIAAYWRCDENFGNYIYDLSKSSGDFHKNDGAISGASWDSEIPNSNLLGWMGKTDEKGNYTIPYIPYYGSGENFTITPRYEQHQFEANQKTVFIGEGASILSEQDFTDISSFKLTGTVFYENTYCGVEGAIIGIDGEPVIKNGKPIYTDQYGEFEIAVPVGEHYVYVEKSGHEFLSYKFPPGPETATFDFQEPMNGVNFIDKTKVTVVGRVVGGTIEGDKKPGLGLSKNNIGVAEFKYEAATGCSSYDILTDSLTGEFSVDLPPMKYLIKDFQVNKNPAVSVYFSEFPEADFSIVTDKELVTHTYTGEVDMVVKIDTVSRKAYLDIDGLDDVVTIDTVYILNAGQKARFFYERDAFEYALDTDSSITIVRDKIEGTGDTDSAYYNYRYDLIYRTSPEVRITASNGESEFTGDKVVRYEDPISGTQKEFDVKNNPFQYPLFTQGEDYSLLVYAEEVYYNQDVCAGINGCPEAAEDRVPVNDGLVYISNQLALEENPAALNLTDGTVPYTFIAGEPSIIADVNFPWRSYSGVFNITVNIDNVGYEWEPFPHKDSLGFSYPLSNIHPDDKYFRGYVLGANPIEGSDFITEGPQMVDMILRDPPGSESYSYVESGTTFYYEEAMSVASSQSAFLNSTISLGTEFSVGLGVSKKTKITFDIDAGISSQSTGVEEGALSKEITVTESWQTSEDPELAGALSDLFFGSSVNYSVSLADNLSIFPATFADDNGITTAGEPAGELGNEFKIGINKSLMAAPDGSPTYFLFTTDHIQNYLIPNIVNVRNNLFISDPKYTSNIPFSHPLYGSNNDDPDWGDDATSDNPVSTIEGDFDGPSYTFIPESSEDRDLVRKYNEQIRLWEDALERNEMEKYYAELDKNISFDAGPTFEYSTSTSVSRSHSTSFELQLSESLATTIGAEIGGLGGSVELGLEVERSTGHTTTTESTKTNTFGYVLHDPDQGDYFSVDVKDPGTGTGPVFGIKGGRSMCPHETATDFNYFTPAKYTITDSVVTVLEGFNAESSFLDILSWGEKTGKYTLSELESNFTISTAIKQLIPGTVKFTVPQINERQFKKRYELQDAINDIIDLHLNLGDDEDLVTEIMLNMESMSNEELESISGQIITDSELGGTRIYIFPNESRELWKKEFLRYQSQLYALSGKLEKNVGTIDASTIRREVPTISITPALRENVPEDNKAYFTLQLGNASYTGETMWYDVQILEETNPNGAQIFVDGEDVHRNFEINAGQQINKTLTVEMGRPDVYEYDSIQIVIYSPCEWDYHTNGMSMPAEAIDTVTFSVHFVPSCTDVEIAMPSDDYIINTEDVHLVDGVKETKVPILLTGYDMNNLIFDKMSYQFKSSANPDWIVTDYFHVAPEDDENGIPGNFTALEWDLSGYPDGEYNIRAKTYCGTTPEGTEIFDLSEVWTGIVDRKPPQVFGSPQPADGILSPDDDIIIEFNEEIFGEKLTELANFDIRGILNGTEIRHDVSVGFDNDPSDFVRIPNGINLVGKSFTIEFWMKPERSNYNECIISQSADPNNAVAVRLNSEGYFEFQVGHETHEEEGLSVTDIIGEWHHFAFVYDNIRKECIVMMDGEPIGSGALDVNYTNFGDIYLGKSLSGTERPFKGNIHELRIWERPRTASAITANMLITLSGKETGLVGYWPFDDAYGELAAEKVHKRNATVNTFWDITPSGYAATFNSSNQGLINLNFSDIAFTPEENFTIEFWFKSNNGSNTCLLSNGRGDENDLVLYYISPEGLANIANVLPLVDSVEIKLQPLVNRIFSDKEIFIDEIGALIGSDKAVQYTEQLLRFGKHMPTYWSINTDASGYLQVNNNGKRIKYSDENYFDNRWHHFALVVQRVGNTRVFVDGELRISEPSTEWNGFGAARLFIGARGLFNQDIAGFEFDQYFNGSLDEVRVWNTALKQSQIQRNSNMRLDGDELGLVAYFPFESYEDLMGVPVIDGLLTDVLSDRESLTNVGVFAQNTDVPNIRMVRPSSKVDFSFVPKSDRVAFVINEPIAKIENCILDITTKNVEDMYGNKMSSPVTWSAFVDMNQVKWSQQQFDLEKRIYDPLSFTAKIVNNSGQQQNFSLENLPGWLTAEPREGTLNPLTEVEVTFTVNEGVNIGRYSINVNLQTDFDFDEKLLVNLMVYEELPDDWQIEPSDFEHSMNVIGMVTINNVISTDKYDKVAAFVDGECRGIANLKYIPEYDMYEAFLDIYSNQVAGEYFELHLWDASDGREFRMVQADGLKEAPVQYDGLYEFVDNTIYGSPSIPVSFEANNTIIQKIPLTAGWNWKSFNLTMDRNKPLTYQLEGLDSDRGDMVKGLTKYSEFSSYWIGTLNYLDPEDMYMFKVSKDDTLKVSGIPVNPLTTPIDIVQGWNWIGYTPQVNISINDALGRFTPNHGDLLKSQFAFAMYDELMGWVGTLTFLKPNEGYKYKYIPQGDALLSQQLFYPEEGTILKSGKLYGEEDEEPSIVSYSKFQDNMPLIAIIDIPADKQSVKDELSVYSNDELRGKSSPIRLEDGRLMYFISVYGNQVIDTLSLQFKNHKGQIVDVKETLNYSSSDILGSTSNPVVLTVDSDDLFSIDEIISYNIYPNPFNTQLQFELSLPEDEKVEIEILNVIGKSVSDRITLNGSNIKTTINTSDLKSGIYMVKLSIGGSIFYEKLIKK